MIGVSQKTINSKISCSSVGLHTGAEITMTLLPASCDSGIIFRRVDLEKGKNEIKANYKNVVQTNLGTVIANEFGAKVSTVEHLMAAIWGAGIDNLLIDINGPEVPVMDGSSEPFVFLIECGGINIQSEPRRVIEVLKKIRVEEKGKDGTEKFVEIEPSRDFSIDLEIDFKHKQIKQQKFDYHSNKNSFKNDICRARTFGFKHEIDQLHKMGLAKGGSLDNAILVDEEGIVNKGGLRYEDEFVRHKTLDFIGDMYLAGGFMLAHFKAFRTGHGMNNKILHELFKDQSAFRMI
jgi:UDP-3-O-[3-hydroxymyristoyl] N-acetylglucosamine deacetylase